MIVNILWWEVMILYKVKILRELLIITIQIPVYYLLYSCISVEKCTPTHAQESNEHYFCWLTSFSSHTFFIFCSTDTTSNRLSEEHKDSYTGWHNKLYIPVYIWRHVAQWQSYTYLWTPCWAIQIWYDKLTLQQCKTSENWVMAVESEHSKKLIFRTQPARNPARGAIIKKSVIFQAHQCQN